VKDTNLLGPYGGGLPRGSVSLFWEGPCLVALARKKARLIAYMVEETAAQLGLDQFRSRLRDHLVNKELWDVELDFIARRLKEKP
jgi:hypothetical protein